MAASAKSLLEELSSNDSASKPTAASLLVSELADDESATSTTAAAPADVPWYRKAAHGLPDPAIGAGQFAQHVLGEKASNVLRSERTRMAFPMAGPASLLLRAASGGKEVSTTEEVDESVRQREEAYQRERKEVGEKGVDWWRMGGSLANPMSWLGGGAAGAGIKAGIKAGAATGAFQALLQPVPSEGNFLWDKGIQAAVGGAAGGTLGGALGALRPVFTRGAEMVRGLFAKGDDAIPGVARRITDDTLKAADVDPAKMDPSLYSAIRQEVADALKAGVNPDPKVMANRADATALPVPIQLTRGQASRDPMQFSWEINTSKLRGGGEDLSARLTEQNRQLIENLNQFGARNAPSTFDASQKIIQHIEGVDVALKSKVDEAYSAVRDSAGRPALMSTEAFTAQSKNMLTGGRPEMADLVSLADYLPETVAKQYNDILQGKLPLTVDTAQFLDRAWGGVQRGTQDATVKNAIGALRSALNDAPVSDALGAESMAAYQAAKQLARQRFAMIEQNPAYKAVVDGVEPDKFFQKYVQGANVSELGSLKQLIGAENTGMLQQTFLGNLKKAALNRASDENGVFSQSAYNRVFQDPVQAPRIQELFKDAPQILDQLYRLGRVAENTQAFPKGHGVNVSNTAPTGANIIRDIGSSEIGNALWGATRLGPLRQVVKEARGRSEISARVSEALEPGVTPKPIQRKTPSEVRLLSDLLTRSGAIAVTKTATEREE